MPLSRMAACSASLVNMTKLSTVCGRTAERLARRPCSPKRFRTVPEFILLSPGMAPAVTSLSLSLSFFVSVSLSVCLSLSLSVCLSVSLSVCLSVSVFRGPWRDVVIQELTLSLAVSVSALCLSLRLSLCVCLTLSAFRGPWRDIIIQELTLSLSPPPPSSPPGHSPPPPPSPYSGDPDGTLKSNN